VPIAAVPAAWAQAQRLRPRANCGSRVAGCGRPGRPAEPTQRCRTEAIFPAFQEHALLVSGQTNFIFQALPGFHAAYSGRTVFGPDYEKATSRVMTLYTGVRLNDSTELLVNIEEAGGAALSTGWVGCNTDLDIVRNPLLSKEPYLARGMIHKVFALSRDKVENQRSSCRCLIECRGGGWKIRFGQVQPAGFLDQNSVGSDTHLNS